MAAVILFLALGYIYCSPQLKGKVLYAGDQQNFTGAVHESQVYHDVTGDYTFWNGAMFSGMPNYQIGGGYYSSSALLQPINSFIHRPQSPAWIIFLYFLCFFICLRCFDVDKWLSIAGAIAIGLSSYFLVIIGAGHLTKTMTIAATAVVLGGFNLIFSKKKYILGAILTMVFVAGGATKHPQMFYYYFMLIALSAGASPARTPRTLSNARAAMAAQKLIWKCAVSTPSVVEPSSSISRTNTVKSMPIIPATMVSTTLSAIICERMFDGVAPMARRIPISVVRSFTVTIMMLLTPMAPARSVPMPTSMMRKFTPENRLSSIPNITSELNTLMATSPQS